MTLYDRYRFHKDHGGYIVGRRAECAIRAARAEILLQRAVDLGVASVVWEYDCEPYAPGDCCSEEEAAAKFDSGEWTGPFGCVVTVGDADASLWGIVVGQWGTNDPYCRVVESDLAIELEDDLRQAIGDALDSLVMA